MLSGVGQLRFITKNLKNGIWGEEILFPGQLSDFSFELTTETKKAKAWHGRKKVVSSAPGDEDNTLKIAFEYLDWMHLGFAYDELPQISNNVMVPLWKTIQIPLVAPFEIIDPDIIATNENSALCYLVQRGAWGEAGPMKRGAGSRQFDTDGAANTLTFNATEAGAFINYQIHRTYSQIQTIGREMNFDSFGKLEFWGTGEGPEFPQGIDIHFWDITRTSAPSFQTDDVPKFEIEFTANTPPGRRSPFEYLNMATAVA